MIACVLTLTMANIVQPYVVLNDPFVCSLIAQSIYTNSSAIDNCDNGNLDTRHLWRFNVQTLQYRQ
jgi:hypothetical protein